MNEIILCFFLNFSPPYLLYFNSSISSHCDCVNLFVLLFTYVVFNFIVFNIDFSSLRLFSSRLSILW